MPPIPLSVPPRWLPLEPADGAGSVSAGAVAIARQGDQSLAFVEADPSVLARGEAVFRSEAAGCAACHAGAALTDGDTHDVQSSKHAPTRRGFDTPSLHLVAHSAPYFHDGRYATMSELLAGSDGTMGHTAQLSPGDLAALEVYLQRL